MFDYQNEYNDYWSRPDRWGSHSFADPQPLVDEVLRTCGTGNLLDVGCGMGLLVRRFLASGVDAHGLDVANAPVAQANKFAPGRFRVGSILDLPFPDESFQTVISTDCLEHLAESDIPRALAELHRVAGRCVFVRLATTPSREERWHLTVHDRPWWETRFFEAGFRKHPLLQTVLPFESLENDGRQITLIFEKIPAPVFREFLKATLQAERDWRADMLRETGRLSDAHIARYDLAKNYVRPGDTVLDLACGPGYGSAILWDGSDASQVIGMDASSVAVKYAVANFCLGRPNLKFHEGDITDLSRFADESVDMIVSFETLEHLKNPEHFVNEARRILRPGGRFLWSVPNQRADQSVEDPNRRHHHGFDLAKLKALVEGCFLTEQLFAQTAGGGTKSPHHRRRLIEIDNPAQKTNAEAEWWLLVAMKDPVAGDKKNYVETAFPTGLKQELNIIAFARDYQNPWLVRSMVTMGQRCRSTVVLHDIARRVLESAPPGSADAGAALCVSGYLQLESQTPDPPERAKLIDQLRRYIDSNGKTAHAARWRISNQYLLAKLLLSNGHPDQAREEFWKCAQMDCLVFSPLLATKTVDAAFWAGWLSSLRQQPKAARTAWQQGLDEAHRVLSGSWEEIVGNPDRPVLFGLREATLVLDAATRCTNGLSALENLPQRPGYSTAQVLYSLSSELKRQEAIARQEKYWVGELEQGRRWLEQQNAELRSWTQELDRARTWLEEQRSTWQHTAEERGKLTQQQSEWSQKLEHAKVWLDQQAANWRQAAEKSGQVIEEQRAWMKSLEHGKNWLEQERDRWHQLAEEQAQTIQQQQQKLGSLEQNRAYLEKQRYDWQRLATDKDKILQELRATIQSLEQQLADARTSVQKQQSDFAALQQEMERQQADLQSKIGRRDAHLRDLEARFSYRALARLKLLPPRFPGDGESDSGEKRPEEH